MNVAQRTSNTAIRFEKQLKVVNKIDSKIKVYIKYNIIINN